MKVLIVHGFQIEHYPPVRNLIEILLRNGHMVTIITKGHIDLFDKKNKNLKFIEIPANSNGFNLSSVMGYFKKCKIIQELVEREMPKNDVLWTTTDTTVRDLGKCVYKYKHVMQLMELIEDVPLLPNQYIFWTHVQKYAHKAYKVVVPEYNRAQIQKVFWNLEKLPEILPNKPVCVEVKAIPEEIKKFLDEVDKEERKIILYQGNFDGDRELNDYAEAVSRVSDKYCLYLMGRDSDFRVKLCEKYPDIKYIPFIKPPYHLLVTQKAFIGLLPYKAVKLGHLSPLNALYCAPNKIYEYAGCGLPMIGSDVPGLAIPFETNKIGLIRKDYTVDELVDFIKEIEANYASYKQNCLGYFESVDLDTIVEKILA